MTHANNSLSRLAAKSPSTRSCKTFLTSIRRTRPTISNLAGGGLGTYNLCIHRDTLYNKDDHQTSSKRQNCGTRPTQRMRRSLCLCSEQFADCPGDLPNRLPNAFLVAFAHATQYPTLELVGVKTQHGLAKSIPALLLYGV